MDQEAINRDLREKSPDSKLQKKLLEIGRNYMRTSSDAMCNYWDKWVAQDDVFRGYRVADKDDVKAAGKGEPNKIIVPLTYAYTQTALSFLMGVMFQRPTFFELQGTGPEDQERAYALERDIDYQLHKKNFELTLYRWMLSCLKHGIGVTKTTWETEYVNMRTQRPKAQGLLTQFKQFLGRDVQPEMEEVVERHLCFEGNDTQVISPFNFFPDPNVSLLEFNKGQFIAHEEEVSLASLQALEGELYHGTDNIPNKFSVDLYKERRRSVGKRLDPRDQHADILGTKSSKVYGTVVHTEIELSIVPKKWSEEYGIDFGDSTQPVKYLLSIVNDQKPIRFEPAGYLHDKYIYNIIEYSPDVDSFMNPGLAGTISELQGMVNWFLNSHVVEVRRALKNRFVADPSKINISDINNGSDVIRTKMSGQNLRGAIEQLQVSDVTSGHVGEMGQLNELIQLVTGINENALGQFASGRRSASEARNVSAGAAARLKMHAQLMWSQGIKPMGEMYLANTLQGRSPEVYNMIHGSKALDIPFEMGILSEPEKIAAGYDFKQLDVTLPSEKQARGRFLTDIFTTVISNPQAMQITGLDPTLLLNRIAELYGINNLKDFAMQTQQPQQTQVVPDDVAEQAAAQGAQGVDVFGQDILAQLQGQ